MDYRIISIGTLARHELWTQATTASGPEHATTTLIRVGERVILVDPGLPAQLLLPRLAERSGLSADDITDVFLTSFHPAHRLGIKAFPNAAWWIAEREREVMGQILVEKFQREEGDAELQGLLRDDIALLQKCRNAPDQLAPQIDLFPLHGYSAGTCGLLLAFPRQTVLIAGDAVATGEHLEQGRVLRGAVDVPLAQESLREAIEIADVIVPGHDNVILNPMRQRGVVEVA